MDSSKSQLVEKIQSASNILVTVSRNPSVDQLAACLGLTLLLNKLDKHTTAVFSGHVPSTIEFLEPEQTLEKNTDSLRDFIIALDKSKADKLRYKVEDELVRIFITPYRTSISQNDLEFSQGDFNVDLVIALGVQNQEDLDQAITAHGRILHDATVASINVSSSSELGSINWLVPKASSLSELVTELSRELGETLLDQQIATALLTGIVAETERFSNEKTSSQTMSASAELMSAGANQQLVATKLEETPASPETTNESDTQNDDDQTTGKGEQETAKYQDGVLEIEHSDTSGTADEEKHAPPPADLEFEEVPPDNVDAQPANDQKPDDKTDSTPGDEPGSPNISEVLSSVSTGDDGVNQAAESNTEEKQTNEAVPRTPKLVTEPPQLGGMLTANSQVEPLEPSTDPLSLPSVEAPSPLLNRPPAAPPAPHVPPEPLLTGFTPPPPAWVPPSPTDFPAATPPASPVTTQPISDDQTLTKLEETVNSPHLAGQDIDAARDEVMKALSSSMPSSPEPIEALNAQPLGGDLHSGGSQQSLATAGQDFMATLQQTIPSLPPTGGAPAPPDQASISQPTFPPEAPASYENLPGNESVPSLVVPHSDSMTPPPLQPNDAQASVTDPNAPPPVPPPIPYHFGNTPEPPKNNQ